MRVGAIKDLKAPFPVLKAGHVDHLLPVLKAGHVDHLLVHI